MAAYYNEVDPFAAAWLRELIRRGLIADGEVDERSIEDVHPRDLDGYTQCHFFAGLGAWSSALRLAGWPDDRPVWTGSCPCQPFSKAGKGEGTADERHLWPEWFYLITEHRPNVIFGEQVANKGGLAWLDLVQADVEGIGYAIGAVDLCAAGVGAPHIRQRIYWVAERVGDTYYPRLERYPRHGKQAPEWQAETGPVAEAGSPDDRGPTNGFWANPDWCYCRDGKWRPVEPGLVPMVDGAFSRVGRVRSYGNAIVVPLAAEFIKAYMSVRYEEIP